MPTKKKPPKDANESKWVRKPTAATGGHPLCDVVYEHRRHAEAITVLGVEFIPGQIVTYKSRSDVPLEFIEHPELMVRDVPFGVCRIDQMFRYTPLTLFAFEGLKAGVSAPEPVARPVRGSILENPTIPEPEEDE